MRMFNIVSAGTRAVAARWQAGVVCGLVAVLAVGAADAANARSRNSGSDERPRAEKNKPAEAPRKGPLFAVVSIADQHVSFYGEEGLVTRSAVSTGAPGHRTPTGVFSILGKERYHESNLYSSAPMPFMQRITWSGVAMHEGILPGYAASHGCIRMPRSFAQRMFGMTKVGQRVMISPHEVTPARIAHPTLPVPLLLPSPADPAPMASTGPAMAPAAGANSQSGMAGNVEEVALKVENAPARLNPLDYAWAMRAKASADGKAAAKALKDAMVIVRAKQEDVRGATMALRAAEAAATRIRDEIASLLRKAQRLAGDSENAKQVIDARRSMEAKLAEVQQAAEVARQGKQARDQELAAAWQSASQAETAGKDAKIEDQAAAAKEDEARAAAKAVKAAESYVREIEGNLASARRRAERAETEKAQADDAIAKVMEAKAALDGNLAAAGKTVDDARQVKAGKDQELAAAQKVAQAAQHAGDIAKAAFDEATRRLEPVSVFVSRKTGRLYVRQAFRSVLDVPVTIKEPERPVGTHVFVSTDAEPDASALRWWSVTMADHEPKKEPRQEKRRKHSDNTTGDANATGAVDYPPETAAGALSRIEIPEDAKRRIAEMAWAGASFLVSDQAMSGETGEFTDFIILTRGKPGSR